MTEELAEWQSKPELVAWWDKQINSPQGRLLVDVLRSLSTAHNLHKVNADVAMRNAPLFVGQQQSFSQVIENLFMLAKAPPDPAKQILPTYGARLDEDSEQPAKPKRKKP